MTGVKMKKSMLFEAVVVLLLILLAFVLYVMVTSSTGASDQWTLPGMVGSPGDSLYGNMFTGDDGMLYTVDGTNVNAIDQVGHLQWSLKIPYLLNGINVEKWMGDQAEADNGTFYIELVSADEFPALPSEILAISPEGRLLWAKGMWVPIFLLVLAQEVAGCTSSLTIISLSMMAMAPRHGVWTTSTLRISRSPLTTVPYTC